MSINDLLEKIKPFYTLILCIVIASIFFGLGRLSAIEERKTTIRIIQPEDGQITNMISAVTYDKTGGNNTTGQSANVIDSVTQNTGEVVGSKNGTKYYFPWCGSLKLIKPENRVTFASADLAKNAGYTPAANCKGLK